MDQAQLNDKVIAFTHYLREQGHQLGIKELGDSLHLISQMPLPDQRLTRHYLRALCCHNKRQWDDFNRLFNNFWYPEDAGIDDELPPEESDDEPINDAERPGSVSGMGGTSTSHFQSITDTSITGAGKQNTITKADFRFLGNQHEMRIAENMAEQLALKLKKRTQLKHKSLPNGKIIDIRQTLRRNMSNGGIPLDPVYSVKYRKPPHLVILHDVSHSMNWNNPLLFRFARGLIKACPGSDAFVFHTRLFCVTTLYREKSLKQMRNKLESRNHLWLGGTCIAESINSFNRHHAKRVLRKDSIVIIISDGLDTDTPEYLARQLELIRSKTKQMLWLNPMMLRQKSLEKSASLRAAKPFVDLFMPAHSVESLDEVIQSFRL